MRRALGVRRRSRAGGLRRGAPAWRARRYAVAAASLVLALAAAAPGHAQSPTTAQPPVAAPPTPPPTTCVVPEPGPPPLPRPPPRPFPIPPPIAAAPAESAGQSSADAYPFPITRHRVSGLWLAWVKRNGDVDNVGLPRSPVICDPITGQVAQYFQRVVLEYHPEQPLADRIQRRLLAEDLYPEPADPPADPARPPGPDAFYFPLGPRGLGHFISSYAPDGTLIRFKEYWDSHGREEAFGYPKEEPRLRDGRWTQRFQAAVFEHHPENDRPGLSPAGLPIRNYAVQLRLLGDEYIAKYNLGLR
jgi:hypothetical protein